MKYLIIALAASALLSTAEAGTWSAAGVPGNPFLSPSFTGTTATSVWNDLSKTAHPGYPGFPGTGSWSAGPLGPNTTSGSSTSADLYKVANGFFGGPFPSSQGLYFGGFSYFPNTIGGELGIDEAAPVTSGSGSSGDVRKIAFQIQTGEAYGYDFHNGSPVAVLTYTTSSGTHTATLNSSSNRYRWNNGDYEHEEGEEEPQEIWVNTYYFDWDLSGVSGTITSFQITWESVQHSQIYGLRLDQSSY